MMLTAASKLWMSIDWIFLADSLGRSCKQASIAGKRITDVGASFSLKGSKLHFSNIKASAYGGLLAAESFLFDTGSKDFSSRKITIDRLDLQEFARDTKSYQDKTLAGKVSLELVGLAGNGSDAGTVVGKGRLVVRDAVLWEVPVFLKLVSLNFSELFSARKQFDAGAVEFEIRNRKIAIEKLAMTSETASVVGRGRIGFDGELHLTLKGKSGPLLGIDFFILNWAGEILSFLTSGVEVDVRGTFDKPEIK